MSKYEVPPELQDLLLEFTVAVLVEEPRDIVDFAVCYFSRLRDYRRGAGGSDQAPRAGYDMGNGLIEDGGEDESDEYIEEPPIIRRPFVNRRKSVFAEAYNPEADDDDSSAVVIPKTDDQRKMLMEAVKRIFLFKALDPSQLSAVVDAMFERQVKRGEYIIRQGEDGDNFYVIECGTYDIFVETTPDQSMPPLNVGRYENSGYFGELALMYNVPRAATIQASTSGALWALDRTTFRKLVLQSAFKKRKMYENLINSVPILQEMTEYERGNVADALVTRSFRPGELIIRQGDPADGMYFVESGNLVVTLAAHEGGVEAKEKEINRLGPGGYFGELALITHQPRAANVRAIDQVLCAFLEVEAFERLMGKCVDILQRNASRYEEQLKMIHGEDPSFQKLRS
ncbi:unnamed protein product [Cyprideis torosa]|uniref:cAMP-dependent protein kinase type II regulatory subunit n=1 Tax=Cyprideis torosa TaxID=163714 RepID=A0A7R8WAX8_9CRUS|nr:unnamed protein product [Cyprideis torosa]CAG0885921.1 unnamed protein product [Cyprideis torosa]